MTRAELIATVSELQDKLDGDAELRNLVEELSVHQEELQQQQRALVEAQQELESSRDRYAGLFDFAPLGYVSLDTQGIILEANEAACQMLERDRTALSGIPLIRNVAPRYRNA